MELIILVIFILLFLITNKICEKSSLTKIVANIYLVWWFVWLELSISTKDGIMLQVSNKTYWIFILNVVAFITMYLLVDKKYSGKSINLFNKKEDQVKINTENKYFNIKTYQSAFVVWIVGILVMTILLIYLKKYNILLEEYGMSYARIIRFELGYMLKSPFELLFYNYILQAILNIISILVVINILNGKFRNPIIYIGIINIVLNSQIGKGRMIIFELLIYFIIGFIIYFYDEIWKYIKKYWYIILIIFVVCGSAMTVLTLVRLNTDFTNMESIKMNIKETFDQVILYFTGSIRAFDYSLVNNYRDTIIEQYGHTWGMATFAGINEVIIMFFRGLGMEIATTNMAIGSLTQPAIFIGENVQYNAFYSAVLNYYIDFGVVGVALFSGLFGAFSAFLIKKSLKTKDVYYTMILIFNLYIIIFSLLRWEYQAPSTWMIISMILIVRMINKKYDSYCESKGEIIKLEEIENRFVKKKLFVYNWLLGKSTNKL